MAELHRDGQTALLGDVAVQNNTWGRADLVAGRDFSQRIEHGAQVSDGLRMVWDWPGPAQGVRAYPEVYAGRKPWGGPQAGDLLPAQLQDLSGLTARYDLAWGGEADGFNITFDLWISSDPEGGPEAIAQEVMIWLRPGDLTPAGRDQGQLSAGGLEGPLHVREGHGAGWTYVAWTPSPAAGAVPGAGASSVEGELDISALLFALQGAGLAAPESWLMTVELGAEITHGAGWLEVRDFSVWAGAADHAALPSHLPLPALRLAGDAALTSPPVTDWTALTLQPDPAPVPVAAAELALPF